MKRKSRYKNTAHEEQLKNIVHNFAATHDAETNTSELTIYGEIGSSWWDDSTSATEVKNALKNSGTNDIVVRLNSPGGDAFDGIAIYNLLKDHAGKVTVKIDGWACSAASIIAMAGDEVIMGAGAMGMIHQASTIVWGDKGDMRQTADMLEELESGIIDIYMTKFNLSREEVIEMVNAETWLSAKKAVEIGFATSTTIDEKDDSEEVENLRKQIVQMQAKLDEQAAKSAVEPTPGTEPETKSTNAFLNYFKKGEVN